MDFGDYRIEVIPDTQFRLDGGAMFGVVPRVLWERVCPPDESNRVTLNMNCVFIDTGDEKILIETGIGEKWSEKETRMYGIFRERPLAETLFEKTGCQPADISIVVNTHLHFDHAGGNTKAEPPASAGGRDSIAANAANDSDAASLDAAPTAYAAGSALTRRILPQFPNTRYFVSKREFEAAENPHERDRASYLPENWQPLHKTGQLELKPDDYEVVDGLSMETVVGHSKTMQTWRLDRGGKTLYGFADLIPTRHHLALPWIMGYDLFPTETLEFKRKILPQAVNEKWECLFYHDPEMPLCRLAQDGEMFRAFAVE